MVRHGDRKATDCLLGLPQIERQVRMYDKLREQLKMEKLLLQRLKHGMSRIPTGEGKR